MTKTSAQGKSNLQKKLNHRELNENSDNTRSMKSRYLTVPNTKNKINEVNIFDLLEKRFIEDMIGDCIEEIDGIEFCEEPSSCIEHCEY